MLKRYFSMLRSEFSGYNLKAFSSDLMAGLTVTAVALPLALAFGVSCGADAAAGLVTAILAGLVIGALSGASFQISGPTGAMSAVLVTIIAKFGLDGVFAVSFFAARLVLLCAILKLGRFVSLIPRPVITGFTSGIALIIALGQIDNFFGTHSVGESAIQKLWSFLSGDAGSIDWKAPFNAQIIHSTAKESAKEMVRMETGIFNPVLCAYRSCFGRIIHDAEYRKRRKQIRQRSESAF